MILLKFSGRFGIANNDCIDGTAHNTHQNGTKGKSNDQSNTAQKWNSAGVLTM
jgi:hypothetical protein